ncbi:glycoside hydrolase family 43 protein [Nocardioides bruguierae]|uniref:Glycoside hydrolase family 43 protein n=1 Tax=Nocardioides bruguierae TaxID=2945102 RepID=A0A9X2D8R7_9ACTN|nr:glycoside hydrolase family 43 protein [Nocardioides bruguierae]MCM0621433.1 glycoside hydrolase family 43 protein [Nocardioides bruguierae]
MSADGAAAGVRLADVRLRDPFLLQAEPGRYVLLGTSDEHVWGGPATGFDCWTSADLESWHGPVPAFRPPEGFWSSEQFWAPEVHPWAGRFAMVATFLDDATRVRGVAVLMADQATGPYVPWSDGPVTPRGLPCLDGTLHVDDDGSPWLVWSRGAEATDDLPALADGEMWAQRLTADLRSATGEPVLLFRASTAAWSRPLRLPPGVEHSALRLAEDPLFTDGPFLFRRPDDGALHLLWSSFGERGYAMGVAVSSGGVLGPWEQADEPLWPHDGGHGMLLVRPDAPDLLVLHAPNDSPLERPLLAPVAWVDGRLTLV